jgi:hypothetical protein
MVTDPPYGVEYDAGWRNGTPNGLALWRLGERESGTGRLEEAVTAYRAALEEMTRERVPLRWAYTQHALANALAAVAERQKNAIRMGGSTCLHAQRCGGLSAKRGKLLAADCPAPHYRNGSRIG